MQVVGGVVAERADIHSVQDGELLKEERALRPCGALVDVQAVVFEGYGLLDGCVPLGEVFGGQHALVRHAARVLDGVVVDELDDRLGDRALVVFVAGGFDAGDASLALRLLLGGAEGAQHRAEVWVADKLACLGRAAVAEVYLAGCGV